MNIWIDIECDIVWNMDGRKSCTDWDYWFIDGCSREADKELDRSKQVGVWMVLE